MTVRGEKLLVSLALQVALATAFLWLQSRPSSSPASAPPGWLVTPVDEWLPLMPAAVWLYVSWYPAPLLLLCGERAAFRRAAATVLSAFLICAAGFLLLPVTMQRPALNAGGSISQRMLAAVYALDPPHNAFPSFHAALCAVILAFVPGTGVRRVGLVLWMVGICLSCVLTKQHYFLDVLTGLFAGWIAFQAVEYGASLLAAPVPMVARSAAPAEEQAGR